MSGKRLTKRVCDSVSLRWKEEAIEADLYKVAVLVQWSGAMQRLCAWIESRGGGHCEQYKRQFKCSKLSLKT